MADNQDRYPESAPEAGPNNSPGHWSDLRKIFAGILILWTLWTGHWLLSCYGATGELVAYRIGYTMGIHDYLNELLNTYPPHTVGVMWLRAGQSVEIRYQVEKTPSTFKSTFPAWDFGVTNIDFWFGPLEDWPLKEWGGDFYHSAERLSIPEGTGSFVRVAQKTGYHVIHKIFENEPFNASLKVSWRVL